MAKIQSIIQISGSLSGLTFYTLNGRSYAKSKSSLTREKVMTSPAFARSREQMSEFGGAAAVGKAIRGIWAPFKKRAADSRIAGRLNAQLLKALKSAPGLRGQRPFILRDMRAELLGFQLKKNLHMAAVCDAPTLAVTPDRRQIQIAFDPEATLKKAKGATHYRIIAATGLIADFAYDPKAKAYLPLPTDNHGVAVHGHSAPTKLDGAAMPSLNLEFPQGTLPGPQESLVAAWGIEYLQEVNGSFEPLFEYSSMQIGFVG